MQTDENDPYESATYEVSAKNAKFNTGTVVNLYLSFTGVSQGAGRVILNIAR